MIIAPLQGEMVSTLVSGTSMPIFAIDTDFEAEEKISFIGIGQADAAASGGEAAVAAAEAAGWTDISAAYIAGVQGDSTAEARKTGFQKGIEDAGGTFLVDEIQYADAVADKAAVSMEAIMQKPSGRCCDHLLATMTIAQSQQHAPQKATRRMRIRSLSALTAISPRLKSILDGGETITVAQSGYDQGYQAVKTVVAYLNGEEV